MGVVWQVTHRTAGFVVVKSGNVVEVFRVELRLGHPGVSVGRAGPYHEEFADGSAAAAE